MPGGLSGLDLARVIREHHPELPVILATGYSDRADAALRENFALLKKPYSLANLKRVIEDASGGQVRLIAWPARARGRFAHRGSTERELHVVGGRVRKSRMRLLGDHHEAVPGEQRDIASQGNAR